MTNSKRLSYVLMLILSPLLIIGMTIIFIGVMCCVPVGLLYSVCTGNLEVTINNED